jgi:hypothetical protein
VCSTAFAKVLGISRSTLWYKKKAPSAKERQKSAKFQNCYTWFHSYIHQVLYTFTSWMFRTSSLPFHTQHGQFSPRHGEIHLFRDIRLNDIWKAMVADSDPLDLPCYSTSAFINMVRKYFSHVKWPRKTRLGTCTTCLQLQADVASEVLDLAGRKQLLDDHRDFQAGQRDSYYERRGLARNLHNSIYSPYVY